LFVLTLAAVSALADDGPSLTINVDQSIGKVSPLHYGLMTEEINHAYEGGLYGELVQNRAFQNGDKLAHWSVVQDSGAAATITLDADQPLSDALPNSLRLDVTDASPNAKAGVANDGYWGIPITPDTKYRLWFYARVNPDFKGSIRVALESDDGTTNFAEAKVSRLGDGWKLHNLFLKTKKDIAPTAHARLVLTVSQPGTVWFNLVSLFPPTYNNRHNGNRIDIMEKLAALKPSFLRFPGGNYVEGNTLDARYDWKKTIGSLTNRPGHKGCWGYGSTDGFGLLEFLDWCEDLHMEPVLAVFAGYNLNHTHVDAGPALAPYVQDALDEIEYVTGDKSTKWGAERVKDGHPAPFHLTYVEIGNEDWFDRSGSYDARFAQFYDAIKAKYPNIQCISTIGNEHKEQMVHSRKPDVVDEHYYSPATEYDQVSPTKWDSYNRNGPKIFVGEWAAYEDVKPWMPGSRKLPPTPALKSALGDAAWMAAMERNSDLIIMQCYAPLFVNVNPGARQWRPDLIGFDTLNSYGSPSYYAISMFSQNHGDEILKTTVANPPLHYSATLDGQTGTVYLKIVNPASTPESVQISLQGVKSVDPEATAITLSGTDPYESNSIDDREHVVPVTTTVSDIKPAFNHVFPPYSVTVLKLTTHN
jgi:alpha-N-arabinofuranosidase